ncbi:hypothetical protein [Rhodococcus sp. P1Y]|uniref:hypothetical protein n=1 Tax=Rhodococcus sp. P1Y TaxID=1302308 RepID=UPI00129390BF|nr:hypothetical protein [Rhodococcus sp. P1Y]
MSGRVGGFGSASPVLIGSPLGGIGMASVAGSSARGPASAFFARSSFSDTV